MKEIFNMLMLAGFPVLAVAQKVPQEVKAADNAGGGIPLWLLLVAVLVALIVGFAAGVLLWRKIKRSKNHKRQKNMTDNQEDVILIDESQQEELLKARAEAKRELEEERSRRTKSEAELDLAKQTITDRDKEIDQLNLDIDREKARYSQFNTSFVSYRMCQTDARVAVAFFDNVAKVENDASELYEHYKAEGNDMDSFCFFMTRIDRKYREACQKITAFRDYEAELRILAYTGFVPANGLINVMLKGERDETKLPGLFKFRLYTELFKDFAGAAIIMADEYAYMMANMVNDVDKSITTHIDSISSMLRRIVKQLGYTLNYACPFTLITQYENVENVRYADDVGFPKDTIIEVLKMGVAFGSSNPKTEVMIVP